MVEQHELRPACSSAANASSRLRARRVDGFSGEKMPETTSRMCLRRRDDQNIGWHQIACQSRIDGRRDARGWGGRRRLRTGGSVISTCAPRQRLARARPSKQVDPAVVILERS